MNDLERFKKNGYLQKKIFTKKQILNFNKNLFFNSIYFLNKKKILKKQNYSRAFFQKILKHLYEIEFDNFKKFYAFRLFSCEAKNFQPFLRRVAND